MFICHGSGHVSSVPLYHISLCPFTPSDLSWFWYRTAVLLRSSFDCVVLLAPCHTPSLDFLVLCCLLMLRITAVSSCSQVIVALPKYSSLFGLPSDKPSLIQVPSSLVPIDLSECLCRTTGKPLRALHWILAELHKVLLINTFHSAHFWVKSRKRY